MGPPSTQSASQDQSGGLVTPKGQSISSEEERGEGSCPVEAEIDLAHAEGHVYVRLPKGGVLELTPDNAQSIGGSLINEARKAREQEPRKDEASTS